MSTSPEPSLLGRTIDAWESGGPAPSLDEFIASIAVGTPRDRADAVLIDQRYRRNSYGPVPAEVYFEKCPDLANEPELRLDIVYGEFRLHAGDSAKQGGLIERFPDLKQALARQAEVSTWLDSDDTPSEVALGDDSRPDETLIAPSQADTEVYDTAPLLFADYQLQERLGRGAMGEVHRAVQRSLGKPVAVKILNHRHDVPQETIDRFLREARTTASLRHPNIVGVHGIGRCHEHRGGYFLVMDLIEGRSLHEEVNEREFSCVEAAQAVADTASALQYAHEQGIVHRDIKPANVLRTAEGRIVVVDFGLAKLLLPTDQELSAEGAILGTPQFMAPEQIEPHRGEVGPLTDVYALGALLYRLLTKDVPFSGNTTLETLNAILSDRAASPPSQLRPNVPAELDAICTACLQKNAADRPASAGEVEQRLRQYLSQAAQSDSEATVVYSTANRTAKGPSKWSLRTFFALATALAMLVGGGVYVSQLTDQTASTEESDPSTTTSAKATTSKTLVDWRGELFTPDAAGTPILLNGPVISGDRIRLYARLSQPKYAYVFWVGSDGEVQWLDEQGPPPEPVEQIALPRREGHVLPVNGPAGLEVCVLVLRDEPLENPVEWAWSLTPQSPLPYLEQGVMLADGSPYAPNSGGGGALAGDMRGVGPAEPLLPGASGKAIADWVNSLPSEIGEIRYLAIPHQPE